MSLFTTYLEAVQKNRDYDVARGDVNCVEQQIKELKESDEKFENMSPANLKKAALKFIEHSVDWYFGDEDASKYWAKVYKAEKQKANIILTGINQKLIDFTIKNLKSIYPKKFGSMDDTALNKAAGHFIFDACEWFWGDEESAQDWVDEHK